MLAEIPCKPVLLIFTYCKVTFSHMAYVLKANIFFPWPLAFFFSLPISCTYLPHILPVFLTWSCLQVSEVDTINKILTALMYTASTAQLRVDLENVRISWQAGKRLSNLMQYDKYDYAPSKTQVSSIPKKPALPGFWLFSSCRLTGSYSVLQRILTFEGFVSL